MALNIKNPEVERLASEVAQLAGETKTEAIRRALLARKRKLTPKVRRDIRSIERWLEREVWAKIPPEMLGKTITKEEREEILGIGPEGY